MTPAEHDGPVGEVPPEVTCPHCEAGWHTSFASQPWSAWVSSERDGDGQPTSITVARSDGSHVAESDAEALRALLRDAVQREGMAERVAAVLAAHGVEVWSDSPLGWLWVCDCGERTADPRTHQAAAVVAEIYGARP